MGCCLTTPPLWMCMGGRGSMLCGITSQHHSQQLTWSLSPSFSPARHDTLPGRASMFSSTATMRLWLLASTPGRAGREASCIFAETSVLGSMLPMLPLISAKANHLADDLLKNDTIFYLCKTPWVKPKFFFSFSPFFLLLHSLTYYARAVTQRIADAIIPKLHSNCAQIHDYH